MKNKYLTKYERGQIEILHKEGYLVKEIAQKLGRCKATIYNELKRGQVTFLQSDLTTKTTYDAFAGQRIREERSKEKGRPLKIGNDLNFVKFFEHMILEKRFSPCAILAYIRNNQLSFSTNVCFKTLYNYVHHKVFLNLDITKLPYHKKLKHKNKKREAKKIIKGASIEDRPEFINDRKEYGHWEMDTVYGSSLTCLLVFTERMTKQELIIKMKDRTNESVCKALNKLERRYGVVNFRNIFKTITCDNGVEFSNPDLLETSYCSHQKRTNIYYCHPYSSCERGSNENANKLIRRFIPKGSDISAYSNDFIKYIQNWINEYPRKIFQYRSTNMLLKDLG